MKTAQTILAHILNIDALSIDALLLATLQDRVKCKQLVKRRGHEAQSLLNLLQAVCVPRIALRFCIVPDKLCHSDWDFR